jgi:hypothetical protein
MSLSRFPFPADPEAARVLGVVARNAPDTIPLDFAPVTGDLALYIRRGMSAELIARLTGLRLEIVEAFFDGMETRGAFEPPG